jgi:hypothetical protein
MTRNTEFRVDEHGTSNPNEQWEELKTTVLAIELDVLKNINGNVSAGVRARKGLRMLQKKVTQLLRSIRFHNRNVRRARQQKKLGTL